MNSKALFTIQSAVVIALVSFGVGAFADNQSRTAQDTFADKCPGGASSSELCQELYNSMVPASDAFSKCDTANDKVSSLVDKLNQSESGILSARKDAATEQKQARREAQQAQLQLASASDAFNVQVQKINAGTLNAESKLRSDQRKELAQFRAALTRTLGEVSAANQALRAAEDAVINASTGQEAACRTAADASGQSKQKEIDDQAKKEREAGVKYNYAAGSLAGSLNRRKAKRLADIQAEYLTTYKNCMAGINGPGAAANAAIKAAQTGLESARKAHDEKLKEINQEIEDLKAESADAKRDGDDQLAAIERTSATDLAAAKAAYDAQVRAANTATTNANEDLRDAVATGNEAIQMATGGASRIDSLLQAANGTASAACVDTKTAGGVAKDPVNAPAPKNSGPAAH